MINNKASLRLKIKANNFVDSGYIDDGTLLDDIENKPEYLDIFNYLATQKLDEHCFGSVFYIINELDRNVRNHAELDEDECYEFEILLNNNIIKLNVIDYGIGINASLKKYQDDKNNDLLYSATKENFSAYSNWDIASKDSRNSGFGLYLITQLALAPENNFKLISGDAILKKVDGEINKAYLPGPIKGTRVELSIDCATLNIRIDDIQKHSNSKSRKSNYSSEQNERIIKEFQYLNNQSKPN